MRPGCVRNWNQVGFIIISPKKCNRIFTTIVLKRLNIYFVPIGIITVILVLTHVSNHSHQFLQRNPSYYEVKPVPPKPTFLASTKSCTCRAISKIPSFSLRKSDKSNSTVSGNRESPESPLLGCLSNPTLTRLTNSHLILQVSPCRSFMNATCLLRIWRPKPNDVSVKRTWENSLDAKSRFTCPLETACQHQMVWSSRPRAIHVGNAARQVQTALPCATLRKAQRRGILHGQCVRVPKKRKPLSWKKPGPSYSNLGPCPGTACSEQVNRSARHHGQLKFSAVSHFSAQESQNIPDEASLTLLRSKTQGSNKAHTNYLALAFQTCALPGNTWSRCKSRQRTSEPTLKGVSSLKKVPFCGDDLRFHTNEIPISTVDTNLSAASESLRLHQASSFECVWNGKG